MELNYQDEEKPMDSIENNTLNQNFQSELEKERENEKEENNKNKEKKSIKFDVNSISVIPIQESYNLRYAENGYNELDSQTKNIINDPKYSNEKRSKSAFSKKSFREKYEKLKIKMPTNREWNRDPTSELIIRNLEQKIDILTYENFLLSKKLREIENSNKELNLNISKKLMILKAEQDMNNEQNLGENINLKNIDNKKNKKIKKDKTENDVDFYEEINKLKDENNRLRLSNQNLAENNAELNKVIDALKNDINLYKEKANENQNESEHQNENEEKNIMNDNQIDKNQDNINFETNNNIINSINIKDGNDLKMADEQNNSEIDINKYLLNEEQYHQLIEENELLHKKLRSLLLIGNDPKISFNKNSISFSASNHKSNNNIKIFDNSNQNEELVKENYSLKQKIKSLNSELNKMAVENNRKILIIQERLDEYESKQKQYLNKIEQDKNNYKKEEDLDEILNETILAMNRNQNDEESKKMIDTIKNIKNGQKKRISQCLIINNKIKSLLQENAELHNQLALNKKEYEINSNTNSNLNNTNMSNFNNNTNPHICFCGGGNYSVNALKIKDEMIIKYKDKIDENNEIFKLTQNSNNSSNTKNNKRNYEGNNYNALGRLKKEKNEGFEDYLLGKIVNNQKEVLGERAPRFYENNNKYMSKSMQNDDNNKLNNRYNNYHYRGRILEDDE